MPLSLTTFAPVSPGSVALGAPVAAPGQPVSQPNLADLSSSVNLLQQAAAAQAAGNDPSALLELPPLPPMPAPAAPPAVPTDDHGQSNIVFADADIDGTLIH